MMKSCSSNREGEVDLGLKLHGDGEVGPTYSSSTNTTMTDILDASSYVHPFFKPSSGGGMANVALGFPFTATQWKELERQAMIYKYMLASLPIPPDLLYSSLPDNLSTSTTFAPASYFLGRYGNGLNFRWVGNSKDAEPGRCRRTDGKKWRCSRDVAPNQKYCERHMHRGRPRSRKPVELVHHQHSLSENFPITKNTNATNNNNPTKKTRVNGLYPQPLESSIPPPKAPTFVHQQESSVHHLEDTRSLAWVEDQQWQQLMQTSMNSQVFPHQFQGDSLNLNPHVDFNTKSDMNLLERPLIDAWSMRVTGNKDNCDRSKSSYPSSNDGHTNPIDEDMCHIHMGLGVIDSWVGSPTSPGGPLAEVLRPGSIAVSNPSTSVSSPSGVLQHKVTTFSDSSGSSSPICHNSKGKSDVPFNWLN